MPNPAVVLLSGGLDSCTSLSYTLNKGKECFAIFFRYAQRNSAEETFAEQVAAHYHVPLHKTDISLPKTIDSALLCQEGNLPPHRDFSTILEAEGAPATYVPGRNTRFLAYAFSYAEAIGADEIVFSPNTMDIHYPDCSPAYIAGMRQAFAHGAPYPIALSTPLINLDKAGIISLANQLKVPFEKTLSCYAPIEEKHCGKCDACVLRKHGFAKVGIADPAAII